jgi:hypothetical protein
MRGTYFREPKSGARNLVDAGRSLNSTRLLQTLGALTVDGEPYRRLTEDTSPSLSGQRFASESLAVAEGEVLVVSCRVVGAARHLAIGSGSTAVFGVTLNTTTGAVSASTGVDAIASGVADDGRFWVKFRNTTAGTLNLQYRLIADPSLSFQQYDGDGTSGVFVGRIGIERQAATAPHGPTPEQVRASATDITEAGQPDCYGVRWDGFDDRMATAASVDMSAQSRVSLVAGLRKRSDVNAFSAVSHGGAGNGSVEIDKVAANAQWSGRTRHAWTTYRLTRLAAPAPDVAVLAFTADRAAGRLTLDYNGQPLDPLNVPLASPFLSTPVAIGARPDGSNAMAGDFFGLVMAAMSDAERSSIATAVAANTPEVGW